MDRATLASLALLLAGCAGDRSLELTAGDHYGVAVGDAPVVRGLRLNLTDEDVQVVRGVNWTFWAPRDNEASSIRGLALGLYGPDGHDLRGLSIGPLVAGDHLTGVQLGLLGNRSRGTMSGVNLATIVTRAEEELFGLNSALMVGGGGDVGPVNLGVLSINPFRLTDLPGPHVGHLYGLNVGGIWIDYPNVTGFTASGVIKAPRLTGLSVAYGWHETSHLATGVMVAPFNYAHRLRGVQLGLLNYVASNPFPFRWLPLINVGLGEGEAPPIEQETISSRVAAIVQR